MVISLDLLLRFESRLAALFESTRIKSWLPDSIHSIIVFDQAASEDHRRHLDDFRATFFPNSIITFMGSEAVSPSETFDLALWLDPRPYATPADLQRFKIFRAQFKSLRARRHWFYKSNLELYDALPTARLKRLIAGAIQRVLAPHLHGRLQSLLADRVAPHLPAAKAWPLALESPPCSHPNLIPIIGFPRAVQFCPTCGMGFTPVAPQIPTSPTASEPSSDIDATYGPGYALSYRFAGAQEFHRYANECSNRLHADLQHLNFFTAFSAPGRVWDCGCGNGRFAPLWRSLGWTYVGADPSRANIDFCNSMFSDLQFIHALPTPSQFSNHAPFNLIHLSHVLEHLSDPAAFLRDYFTAAAPGCGLLIEVPNAFTYTWSTQHLGFLNREHLSDFSPAMLRALLMFTGWHVLGHLAPDTEPPIILMLAIKP